MKICICGAGAIGGYLGVQLAFAGADVSLMAGLYGDAGSPAQAKLRVLA